MLNDTLTLSVMPISYLDPINPEFPNPESASTSLDGPQPDILDQPPAMRAASTAPPNACAAAAVIFAREDVSIFLSP